MIISSIQSTVDKVTKHFPQTSQQLLTTPPINLERTPSRDVVSFSGSKSLDQEDTKNKIKNLKHFYDTETVKINGKKYTKYLDSQEGSNPAYWASDEKGKLYYIKKTSFIGGESHLKAEYAATKLYRLAGVKTPTSELCKSDDGSIVLKSEYIPRLEYLNETSPAIQEDFAVDAWLANWDSLIYGNTFLKDGKTVKIDNGGALTHRAQGRLKPNFYDRVDELNTLIDGRNYNSTEIYGSMSYKTLIKSFEKVTTIADEDIRKTVEDDTLAQVLINRKNYMADVLEQIKSTPYNPSKEDLNSYMHKVRSKVL